MGISSSPVRARHRNGGGNGAPNPRMKKVDVFSTIESSSEYLALLNQVVEENRTAAARAVEDAIAGANRDEKQVWCLIAYELARLSSQLGLSRRSLTRLDSLSSLLQRITTNSAA
jgi:hypothetical protein